MLDNLGEFDMINLRESFSHARSKDAVMVLYSTTFTQTRKQSTSSLSMENGTAGY